MSIAYQVSVFPTLRGYHLEYIYCDEKFFKIMNVQSTFAKQSLYTMLTVVQCSLSGVSDTDQSASEDAKIME